MSTGPLLTEQMWYIASLGLKRACDITLHCLHQLMLPFHAHSDNFYGDIGQVKVAVRKDCSSFESERLRQLAQQVRSLLELSVPSDSLYRYPSFCRFSCWTASVAQVESLIMKLRVNVRTSSSFTHQGTPNKRPLVAMNLKTLGMHLPLRKPCLQW